MREASAAARDRSARYVLPLLHLLQLAALLAIGVSATFCCDADYYVQTGKLLLRDGLDYEDFYSGYRSYFVPLVFGLLDAIPVPVQTASGRSFPITASIAFSILSYVVSHGIVRREGLLRYLAFALPTLFNPFVLAFVPYPIQESALALFCLPLLVWLISDSRRDAGRTIVLSILLAALAYIIRSSLIWVIVPAAVLIGMDLWRQRRDVSWKRVVATSMISVVAVAALVVPQCFVSYAKYQTYNPYPTTAVFGAQIASGIDMYKYATVFDGARWAGMEYHTPYTGLPIYDKTLTFYFNEPAAGVSLAISHVWSGLHYDMLLPYFARVDIPRMSVWLVLSSLIVIFGAIGLFRMARSPADRRNAIFLIIVFVFSCAYTAAAATEARFGMWGFIALSTGVGYLLTDRAGRRVAMTMVPLAIAYALASLAFNAVLLQTLSPP